MRSAANSTASISASPMIWMPSCGRSASKWQREPRNENKILVWDPITETRLFRGLSPEKVAPAGQLEARSRGSQEPEFVFETSASVCCVYG